MLIASGGFRLSAAGQDRQMNVDQVRNRPFRGEQVGGPLHFLDRSLMRVIEVVAGE